MDIHTLRASIDDIDHQILELISRRNNIVTQIGKWKKEHGLPALDRKRYQEVLSDRKRTAEALSIPAKTVETIWEELHSWAVEVEKNS